MLLKPNLDDTATAAETGQIDALKLIVAMLVAEFPHRATMQKRCLLEAEHLKTAASKGAAHPLMPYYHQSLDRMISEVFDLAQTAAKKPHI